MISTTFIMTGVEGKEVKVRFYEGNCFSIINDTNHVLQVGGWKRIPKTLKNGKSSRSSRGCKYEGILYGAEQSIQREGMKELSEALYQEYVSTKA